MNGPGSYLKYTHKMNLDKAVHTLEGILRGISLDGKIEEAELRELIRWKNEHVEYAGRHPFNEIIPKVAAVLSDGVLTKDESEDLLWVCSNLKTGNEYYEALTSDVQRLFGIIHGLLSDGVLTDDEIRKLSDWASENEHLKGCYSFDEIDSILTTILADGKIEESERESLKAFLSDFVTVGGVSADKIGTRHLAVSGVCAMCPEIAFSDRTFCLTGESRKDGRIAIAKKIESLGGKVIGDVRQDLDYLVVCAAGNYCWAFSCYGRKNEKAVNYRRKGAKIILAHENDLWDALADKGVS